MKQYKETSAQPWVTVAIPTFNRLNLLKRAIESVVAQNYQNLQIIVSDNASTDGTREYLSQLDREQIQIVFCEQNLGMVANWDRCLDRASGQYFLLMSDDDALTTPYAIAKLVSGFQDDVCQNVGVVFSDILLERVHKNYVERTHTKKTFYTAEEIIVDFFLNRVSGMPCATLLRTKDIREIGGYSSFGAALAVDACAWITMVLKYGCACRVAEPLALYRVHQSLSSSSVEVLGGDFPVIGNIIDKNRNCLSSKGYLSIRRAIQSALNRLPLAVIVRRYREDKQYKILSMAADILTWRKMIFTIDNFVFVVRRVGRHL